MSGIIVKIIVSGWVIAWIVVSSVGFSMDAGESDSQQPTSHGNHRSVVGQGSTSANPRDALASELTELMDNSNRLLSEENKLRKVVSKVMSIAVDVGTEISSSAVDDKTKTTLRDIAAQYRGALRKAIDNGKKGDDLQRLNQAFLSAARATLSGTPSTNKFETDIEEDESSEDTLPDSFQLGHVVYMLMSSYEHVIPSYWPNGEQPIDLLHLTIVPHASQTFVQMHAKYGLGKYAPQIDLVYSGGILHVTHHMGTSEDFYLNTQHRAAILGAAFLKEYTGQIPTITYGIYTDPYKSDH